MHMYDRIGYDMVHSVEHVKWLLHMVWYGIVYMFVYGSVVNRCCFLLILISISLCLSLSMLWCDVMWWCGCFWLCHLLAHLLSCYSDKCSLSGWISTLCRRWCIYMLDAGHSFGTCRCSATSTVWCMYICVCVYVEWLHDVAVVYYRNVDWCII